MLPARFRCVTDCQSPSRCAKYNPRVIIIARPAEAILGPHAPSRTARGLLAFRRRRNRNEVNAPRSHSTHEHLTLSPKEAGITRCQTTFFVLTGRKSRTLQATDLSHQPPPAGAKCPNRARTHTILPASPQTAHQGPAMRTLLSAGLKLRLLTRGVRLQAYDPTISPGHAANRLASERPSVRQHAGHQPWQGTGISALDTGAAQRGQRKPR
jgi:hypothetical protein